MAADSKRAVMTLGEVLAGVSLRVPIAPTLAQTPILGLDYDSRRMAEGFVFFAFPGANTDGRQYAQQAVERGALAVVSESAAPPGFRAAWIEVQHGRAALAGAARNFYRAPDSRLGVTGITGTNGKTTTTFLTDAVLRHAGKTTGMMGTIEYRMAGEARPAVNTTPESLDVFRFLSELEKAGGSHVTMEVSSHALALGRAYGISFHTAVFTNLTRDHLDFHGTMEDYFAAKQLLFVRPDSAPPVCAVINQDSEYGRRLKTTAGTRVLKYGLEEGADVRGTEIVLGFAGLQFTVEHAGRRIQMLSQLAGRINVYNILAASCAALSYGLDWDTIAAGIAAAPPVPGRFERIFAGQPFLVVVDYAHTDDALRNVIAVARDLSHGRVITLFGCGGDRDRSKRPLMGAAAGEASDFVVLTSDNPRSEDPIAIINDALVGLNRYDTPHVIEPDREKAIRVALKQAALGDIVILAGKGHEPYQVLKDKTIAFDDREVARRILGELGKGR